MLPPTPPDFMRSKTTYFKYIWPKSLNSVIFSSTGKMGGRGSKHIKIHVVSHVLFYHSFVT